MRLMSTQGSLPVRVCSDLYDGRGGGNGALCEECKARIQIISLILSSRGHKEQLVATISGNCFS